MCYRVHSRQPEAQPADATPPLESTPPLRLRPRWAAAAAAALAAGLAAAAWLAPPAQPVAQAQQAEPGIVVTPVTFQRSVPAGPVIEQTATTQDDGVPAPGNDVARASMDGCHHGL